MDKNLILSAIKLRERDFPNVKDIQINAALFGVLAKINSMGLSSSMSVIVDPPSDEEVEGNVRDRLTETTYNYYPTVKCLIIPTNANKIAYIYYNGYMLNQATQQEYNTGNMPYQSYYATQTGELYLSFDLVKDDELIFSGDMGFASIDMLPDYYYNYVLHEVLSDLYLHIERNADMYKIEQKQVEESWRILISRGGQVSQKIPVGKGMFKR